MRSQDTSADLVVEDRFAIVPEWLLDADIGDAAVRLYAVLLRYGQSSGARMPSRATLARRLHKKSTDSVDRALKELVAIGAVAIEHRYDGGQRLTNAYHLRTSRPAQSAPEPPPKGGGRKNAATRAGRGGGGRTDAARVAADSGHDPEHLTQSTSSSRQARPVGRPPAQVEEEIAYECEIESWPEFVAEIQQLRRHAGAPVTRWASRCLASALHSAIRDRGWPAEQAAPALRHVAGDPKTISPMRVAEAGPWWDEEATAESGDDLRKMEDALVEVGGARIQLQTQARYNLRAAGLPITRAAVTRLRSTCSLKPPTTRGRGDEQVRGSSAPAAGMAANNRVKTQAALGHAEGTEIHPADRRLRSHSVGKSR